MSKTNYKYHKLTEDELMDLYDQLASQWALKVEARRNQA